MINFPTHNKGNILDLVLTTSPDLIVDITTLRNRSISVASDHIPISFSLKCLSQKANSNPNHIVPLFSKGDYFGMNEYLLYVNFDFYFTCTNIEYLWSFLKQSLYDSISIFVPMSKYKPHPHPQWFSPELCHQLNKLHKLRRKHKTWKHNNLSSTADSYTNQSWSVTMLITPTKKILTTFDQFADKPLFRIPFSLMTIFQLMIMTRPICSTNSLSVFKSSNIPSPDSSSLPTPSITLDNISITEADVYVALANLDETKAIGLMVFMHEC